MHARPLLDPGRRDLRLGRRGLRHLRHPQGTLRLLHPLGAHAAPHAPVAGAAAHVFVNSSFGVTIILGVEASDFDNLKAIDQHKE
eukprot:7645060-Alexandrium_andersonii.AAC.1